MNERAHVVKTGIQVIPQEHESDFMKDVSRLTSLIGIETEVECPYAPC
jgi:hypothetical protein